MQAALKFTPCRRFWISAKVTFVSARSLPPLSPHRPLPLPNHLCSYVAHTVSGYETSSASVGACFRGSIKNKMRPPSPSLQSSKVHRAVVGAHAHTLLFSNPTRISKCGGRGMPRKTTRGNPKAVWNLAWAL